MTQSSNSLDLIGYACGIGAGNPLCERGPIHLQNSPLLKNMNIHWHGLLTPKQSKKGLEALGSIAEICNRLAIMTYQLAKEKKFWVTVGGDHTCAIGTWSGVSAAVSPDSLGLLWIDAHLDSHTTKTSQSGNIHGMPLAALLGYGDPLLTTILTTNPKLLPKNVCILGVRSYEDAEKHFLEDLNVRIYFMDEITNRGFQTVYDEAIETITKHTDFFGISLDLDAINPSDAPGVGTPEPEGIDLQALGYAIHKSSSQKNFIAAEIAEFNPTLDQEGKTESIIADILGQFVGIKRSK